MPAILQASLPRSGNHLLLKLLWDAIPGGKISTCEYYTAPECCKQIPCSNAPALVQENANLEGDHVLFVHKTHDFKLSDIPTSRYGTIFQARDPSDYLISHLLWELAQGKDFSIGSCMMFINEMSLYYIRMYIKWAVLYADRLVTPPIYYESLLTSIGKARALSSITNAICMPLRVDQLEYSLSKSNIHSHSGKSFQSSVVQQATQYLSNSMLMSFAESQANAILECLPCLASNYAPRSSAALIAGQSLASLESFKASQIPELGTINTSDKSIPGSLTVRLSQDRRIQADRSSARPLFLTALGIGEKRAEGSYLFGSVSILPIRTTSRRPLSKIVVALSSSDQSSGHNRDLWDQTEYKAFLICGDKIIGEFIESVNRCELLADCSLSEPIIPASEVLLLAVGFRPIRDIVSKCDSPRIFRLVSEISVLLYTD